MTVVVVLAALSAWGAAVAAGDSGATTPGATTPGAVTPGTKGPDSVDETVKLTVRYSRFSSSELSVRRGTTVRFVVENLDPIGHEFIIGDAGVHQHHATGTEAHHGDQPGEVSVAANSTAETIFTFGSEPGPVKFGCHLPGHWSYGMWGTVTVT